LPYRMRTPAKACPLGPRSPLTLVIVGLQLADHWPPATDHRPLSTTCYLLATIYCFFGAH